MLHIEGFLSNGEPGIRRITPIRTDTRTSEDPRDGAEPPVQEVSTKIPRPSGGSARCPIVSPLTARSNSRCSCPGCWQITAASSAPGPGRVP
jgi:hypothetical protein